MSTVFVATSIFFPPAMANAAADLLGGGQAPPGQPVLVSLTTQNLGSIHDAFNAAKDDVRVLVFLSPT